MDYKPLEHYGLIGDLDTCALVARDGSIDWYCFPHLESPSIFASILDADEGGYFAVRPAHDYEATQRYRDRTNVLQTTFETAGSRLTVTDFMPVVADSLPAGAPRQAVYRKVTAGREPVDLEVTFRPRPDYARTLPRVESTPRGVEARGEETAITLSSSVPLRLEEHGAVAAPTLAAGETAWLTVGDAPEPAAAGSTYRSVLDETLRYWRSWAHDCPAAGCDFAGEWHDLAVRSGLLLKLLIHRDTGAIAAAPTTSLPEEIGGVRNWDYRYNWIRDAAFTVQALYRLGHVREVKEYFRWFLDLCHQHPADIQPLYGLHGARDLDERELDHLSGYRNSAPVRVGNAAKDQRQLDVYGELVLGLYETALHGEYLTAADWAEIRDIVDYVCEVWDEPDHGIWEVRSEPRHFVYSKVMCWTALDRALKIVDRTAFQGPVDRWRRARAEIEATVLDRGFDEAANTFVRSFGSRNLDATSLLFPVVGFLPFDDPRVQGTIDATMAELTTGDGLVYRYHGEDGLPGGEGAFVLCSFWLVDALALSGRLREAKRLFRTLRGYTSPLGLLAEEIHPQTGEHLGNYPQAFSHIGLLNSALYIARTEGRTTGAPEPLGTENAPDVDPATRDAARGEPVPGDAGHGDTGRGDAAKSGVAKTGAAESDAGMSGATKSGATESGVTKRSVAGSDVTSSAAKSRDAESTRRDR